MVAPTPALTLRAKMARWRAAHDYLAPRTYAPRNPSPYRSLFGRAVAALLPWRRLDYPGRERGALDALGNAYKRSTLRAWSTGRRALPIAAAFRMAALLRSRGELFLALAAELERYASSHTDGRTIARGWATVRDRDGRSTDARNKLGGKAKRPDSRPAAPASPSRNA